MTNSPAPVQPWQQYKWRLVSTTNAHKEPLPSTARSALFGNLVSVAKDKVSDNWLSDLYHDAYWIEKHVGNPLAPRSIDDQAHHTRPVDEFWYGINDTGTHIGTDEELVTRYSTHVYHVALLQERGTWWAIATKVK